MEGNTSREPEVPTPNATQVTPVEPLETEGGVAFEAPKPALDVERETAVAPSVSSEEVDRELEKAGVTTESDEKSKAEQVQDEAPSWLADKKAALASQPEPKVVPEAVKAPPERPAQSAGSASPTLQDAVSGFKGSGATATTLEDIKKREYSDLIRPLRTYKDDIARAIQKNKLSTSDMSVAEQARKLGRMQEERSQLELQEKVEKERARLQALASIKQQARQPERPPQREAEPAEHGEDVTAEEIRERLAPQTTPEPVKIQQADTYEVGELARQAAAIRGVPLQQTAAPRTPAKSEPGAGLKTFEAALARKTDILRENQPVVIQGEPGISRGMKLIFASFALLVIGAGLLAGTFYLNREGPSLLSPLEITTLVFSEQEQEIPVQSVRGATFVGLLTTRAKETKLSLNAISALTSTIPRENGKATALTTQEWFERLGGGAASSLVRALHPRYMLGVHSFEGNQPFLVFKTSFYENAFAGMLEWEKSMSRDLAPLFGTAVLGDMGSNASTSTPAGSVFRDRLINNIDTRVLIDLNGEIRLIYSFVDRQTIVITNNRDTFLEIVNRLNSTRTER